MNSPGDVKIKQAIATLLEAVQEVCSSTSMSGEQDPLNEIAAFDTCLDRFTTKMYQIIANRRRGYNANLPIHQLPPELMTRILAAEAPPSLFKSSGIGYMQRLQELASVSSSWAQLIKDTPSFWANVSNKLSPYHLRQILSRSRSCLLDVEFVHMAPKGTPLNVFIPLVSEHVCRWRSVEINEDSSDGVIRTLRFVQAPALETLCVTLCSDGPYDPLAPVETILCGKTDRLRNVNLVRFRIPWDSRILRGLISLKLGYFGKNGPTVDQLLNILSASPELTTLHLYVLEAGGTSHRAGLLELPALRTLRISQLCPPLERALLSAIRFHGRTNFSLTTDLDVTGFLQDPSIADFASFFRSSLSSSEDLTVTHHSTAIQLELRMCTGCLIDLTVFKKWNSTTPDGLADALEETGSLHSQFIIKGDCSLERMAPLLQSEAKFTTIMLDRTSRPMARHMMGFLATPITTGGTRGWPVPDLKELRISRHSNVNLEDVVEMVASRRKGQETRGVDGALIEPALKACPLLRFRSEGNHLFGRRTLRRLQGMLGEANVFHEETIQDGDDNNDSDNENDDNGLIYSATWFPGETPETEAQIVV